MTDNPESEDYMQNIQIPYSLYKEMKHTCEKNNTLDDYPMSLRVEDVQAILGVGRNTAYALVKKGGLHSVRVGRSIRIPKSELARFLGESDGSPD